MKPSWMRYDFNPAETKPNTTRVQSVYFWRVVCGRNGMSFDIYLGGDNRTWQIKKYYFKRHFLLQLNRQFCEMVGSVSVTQIATRMAKSKRKWTHQYVDSYSNCIPLVTLVSGLVSVGNQRSLVCCVIRVAINLTSILPEI